jgi:serine/threonine protein kinase
MKNKRKIVGGELSEEFCFKKKSEDNNLCINYKKIDDDDDDDFPDFYINNLNINDVIIGEGQWGTVFKGQYLESDVAVKIIIFNKNYNISTFKREVNAYKFLSNLNVSPKILYSNTYYTTDTDKTDVVGIIISELFGISLEQRLKQTPPILLDENLKNKYIELITILNNNNVDIRDLNFGNILVKEEENGEIEMKFIDIGDINSLVEEVEEVEEVEVDSEKYEKYINFLTKLKNEQTKQLNQLITHWDKKVKDAMM